MYSPKIAESLIPVLYHAAKAKRVPMTKFVDLLIRRALATESTAMAQAPAVPAGSGTSTCAA